MTISCSPSDDRELFVCRPGGFFAVLLLVGAIWGQLRRFPFWPFWLHMARQLSQRKKTFHFFFFFGGSSAKNPLTLHHAELFSSQFCFLFYSRTFYAINSGDSSFKFRHNKGIFRRNSAQFPHFWSSLLQFFALFNATFATKCDAQHKKKSAIKEFLL